MECSNFIYILFLIKTASSELLSLYKVKADPPTSIFLPYNNVTLTCLVDLSRGAQIDITWYRKIGNIYQVIGTGNILNNFFFSSRYILSRESKTQLQIIYSMVIQNLMVEDSGEIFCSGYKHLPESLTPYYLNICNNLDSYNCKCMSNMMSQSCKLNLLEKEKRSDSLLRACIAMAVCLVVMLGVSVTLTAMVVRRDGCCRADEKEPTLPKAPNHVVDTPRPTQRPIIKSQEGYIQKRVDVAADAYTPTRQQPSPQYATQHAYNGAARTMTDNAQSFNAVPYNGGSGMYLAASSSNIAASSVV